MKKFSSIESFTHLVRAMRHHADHRSIPLEELNPIIFRGTVKLHGTNGSVSLTPDHKIKAHSREQVLSFSNTNAGFYTFVMGIEDVVWIDVANRILRHNNINDQNDVVTIYGEWVGRGIQKGVAIGQLDKHFVVFAAAHGDRYLDVPCDIGECEQYGIHNIRTIPSYSLTVDWGKLEEANRILNELTTQVEEHCPWGLSCGVDGIGEGIVWVAEEFPGNSRFWFKTKGDKHKVRSNPNKDVAPIDIEQVNSINECVAIVLTVNRMEQMVNNHSIEFTPENTGVFIKAVNADILKEEEAVIRENGLEWKQVSKAISTAAREWFHQQIAIDTVNPK